EDRQCFREALDSALAIDIDANPSSRLANTLMQRRARWLLDDIDRLILPPLDERLESDAKGVAP
ncbi:MAG TPA: TRAP transporter TatT component family protein, partial [Steroidobacteraceae bacterium]|nr:TRAP transporter TatT component family protein [Steroidobacteraceae bacterium]